MRLLLLYTYFLLLMMPAAKAQQSGGGTGEEQKHLLYFRDKANSPFSVQDPSKYLSAKALERRSRQGIAVAPRDFPVNPAYVAALKQQGAKVLYTSRWSNAAVVQCSREKLAELQALAFVVGSQNLNRVAQSTPARQATQALSEEPEGVPTLEDKDYGPAFHQANMLGATVLHEAGFRGEGMSIAVLDAGFPGVNTAAPFAHLFQNGQVKGTYDFVAKKEDVFGSSTHGTSVLSTMAAYAPGKMIGTAFKANYYLFRTEDAASEHNIEEINWLLAAEYADSAGVDVINSSLGYTVFDTPSHSYTYNQLNGNTALVSRAADYAAATGMLVVVSAGNEGTKAWRYISAPADADSVLTVGAVDSLGNHAPFSSYGPTADQQIKPDVMAMGLRSYILSPAGEVLRGNGTSFAGPILAGMATCLWQANHSLSNMQLIQLIRQIGSNASTPNNNIGYGIPNYNNTVTALPELAEQSMSISNPVLDREIVLMLGNGWTREAGVVYVFDATGKLVHKQTLPPNNSRHVLSIKPNRLKRGLYLCQVNSGSQSSTLRFVKL